jgi:hypothetical protein
MRLKIHFLVLPFFLVFSLHGQWYEVQLDDGDMAADLTEALTFTKYPTYPQYLEMMQNFATSYPEICQLDTFGVTPQGRLLLAMKISDHVSEDEAEAEFFYTSSMHGNELVGYPLMLRLINYLLTGYGEDVEVDRLVNGLQIWINPLANPDGTYYPNDDLSVAYSIRETADGTDMNREFPDPLAGEEVYDTVGRAMETKAMMAFLQEHRFTMSANIHSGAEVVNYPWDHTYDLHADDAWFRFVSLEYADEARAVDPDYMALFEDGITNGAAWYKIQGGRQDYLNYFLEGREVTLELSNDFRLDSELLNEYWEKNERSFLSYMNQCLYGIRGVISDGLTGDPVEALVAIPDFDFYHSAVHSSAVHGDFYRLIEEGSYDLVVSAPGYFSDTIPLVQVQNFQASWLDIQLDPKLNSIEDKPAFFFRLYPNPAGERVFVVPANMEAGGLDIWIFSMEGVLLFKEQQYYTGSPLQFNLAKLPAGPYLVRLSFGKITLVRMLIRE